MGGRPRSRAAGRTGASGRHTSSRRPYSTASAAPRNRPALEVLARRARRSAAPAAAPPGRRSAAARRRAARPTGPRCARAPAAAVVGLATARSGCWAWRPGGRTPPPRRRRPPPTWPRQSARTGTPISSITSMSVSAGARLALAAVDPQGHRLVAVGIERHQLGRDPRHGQVVERAVQEDDPLGQQAAGQHVGQRLGRPPAPPVPAPGGSRGQSSAVTSCSILHSSRAPRAVRVALHRREPDVEVARLEAGHRRLRGPHAGGHLGLGQPELAAQRESAAPTPSAGARPSRWKPGKTVGWRRSLTVTPLSHI